MPPFALGGHGFELSHELVLIALPALPAPAAQSAVRRGFDPVPVAFVPVDPDSRWLEGALEAATALELRIAEV